MPWVRREGVSLYVERRGTGIPVLYISGTGADLRVPPSGFDVRGLDAFDVVCFDQRGLGRSDQPPGPYSMADYADDAAAVIDWAGWRDVCVVGVSFGGMVAQELVLRHPRRVLRAAFVCTSSGGKGGSSYPLHELLELSPQERAERTAALVDTRPSTTSENPEDAAMVNQLGAPTAPSSGALNQLLARRTHDTFDRLGSITCPVLVCAGRYDGIAPLSNSEALVSAIPGARLAVFDGGHRFIHEVPAAAQAVVSFLKEAGA